MKTPRQRRSVFALAILTVLVGSLPALASPFYTYAVIAKSGDTLDGFPAQTFKRAVSLNDNGHVAFIAEGAGGRHHGSRSSRREEALISFRTLHWKSCFEVSLLTSAATMHSAKATTARQTVTIDPCLPWARCPFTQRFRVEAFDNILDPVSLNDSGTVAYLALVLMDDGQSFYNLTAQSQYPATKDPFSVVPYQTFLVTLQ
jgi:hypothetical protein